MIGGATVPVLTMWQLTLGWYGDRLGRIGSLTPSSICRGCSTTLGSPGRSGSCGDGQPVLTLRSPAGLRLIRGEA